MSRAATASATTGRAGGGRPGSTAAPPGRFGSWSGRLVVAIPALLAYIPLLLTAPGEVGADTKTYLYLDPGKLLRDAPYVWDSQVGLGTVTHQNIGYLWPMGPFYWVMDAVGIPDWVAQRLWLGSLLFAAALGVRYLLRTIDPLGLATRPGAVLVACLAYMLSPYLLDYSARISVLLLPWAALPWLIAVTARSLRPTTSRLARWRGPALFALIVQTIGGINATALIMVGFGPLLWVVYAVWFSREVPLRRVLGACVRIGLLTVVTSLWWVAGLWAEGKYGLPVIRYTETYKTVASVSSPPEVLRGLGYWFFYGRDKLGPWVEPGVTYTENVPVIVVSYLLPVLALVSAALLRWRQRLFFVLLLVIGAFLAIASHPFETPSLVGSVFKAFTRTDAGLSLRSTPRAGPLVILATAVLLGAGVSALGRRLPRLGLPAAGLVCLLIVANLPTLWTGDMVASNLKRDEDIPQYWQDAAAYLDAQGHDTRILEVPGTDFASYRWGNTVDPITPGLTDRAYVARELFIWGSPASGNLLNAFDRRFHEDTMDEIAISPMAQVMAAGDLVLRADLQYERFRTARPPDMWALLNAAPGLDDPIGFGPTTPNVAIPSLPLIDEITLAHGYPTEDPPAVAVFGVDPTIPIVRAHAASRPLLVAGDGDGIVDAASIGIRDPHQASFYSASYPDASSDATFDAIYGQDAVLLVTDTNRKRARRWGTLRETTGYTERAGEKPLRWDPNDQRLELFPGAGDDAYTVTEQIGGATVTATSFGNQVTYTPNDRAANALDGDPFTSWRAGDGADARGETLYIDLDEPVVTDHISLLQPQAGIRNRWITTARITITAPDGSKTTHDVTLTDESIGGGGGGDDGGDETGQVVSFDRQEIAEVSIEVTGTDAGSRRRYESLSGVGFAEVGIGGVQVEELVRPPRDLLGRAGSSSGDHDLSLLFTRLRSNPLEPVRSDEELSIRRIVDLPTARTFAVSGQARLSTYVDDTVLVTLLSGGTVTGPVAQASTRLPGSAADGARSAIDGDPSTAWTTPFTGAEGATITVTNPAPATIDHLDLEIVTDGRHSVPRSLELVVDGDPATAVPLDVSQLSVDATDSGRSTLRVDLAQPVTGSQFSFTITEVTPAQTIDWYSTRSIDFPVGIAELGIAGVQAQPLPATFDSGCRSDLLTVDGDGVPLRVTGTTEAALHRQALDVELCGSSTSGVPLGAGDHVFRTAVGRDLGIDVDRLLIGSAAGGTALTAAGRAATSTPSGPPIVVDNAGRVSYDVTVDARGEPFWLALGQSDSLGWTATVDGDDLGPSQLIDGYGNGWLVTPATDGPLRIHIEWTPQRVVWVGIAISVVAVLACLAVIAAGTRRRHEVPAGGVAAGGVAVDDAEPSLVLPFAERSQVPPRATVAVASVLGLFALLTTPFTSWYPALSLVVVGAVLAAYRSARGRGWLGLAAATALGLAAAYIVAYQTFRPISSDFDWAMQFAPVDFLGLMTLYLLAAEGLRGHFARPAESARATEPRSPDAGNADAVEPTT